MSLKKSKTDTASDANVFTEFETLTIPRQNPAVPRHRRFLVTLGKCTATLMSPSWAMKGRCGYYTHGCTCGLNSTAFRAGDEISIIKSLWNNIFPKSSPELILDIGSNIGIYSIVFSYAFRDCEIIGFEPVRDNFEKSLANIRANNLDNIKIHNVGIGPNSENRKVYLPNREARINSGLYTVNKPPISFEEIECRFSRLEKIIGNKKSPDIIKIDVEGAEREIIDSHRDFFKDCKLIHIEQPYSDKSKNISHNNNPVSDLLRGLGFHIILNLKNNAIWSRKLPSTFSVVRDFGTKPKRYKDSIASRRRTKREK